MKNAVVLDLDGTILDSLDDLNDAVGYALTKMGRSALPRERTRRFVGNGINKLIERALFFTNDAQSADSAGEQNPNPLFDATLAYFLDYYDKHSADRTKPYDGIIDAIKQCRAAGFATAVVTNKNDDVVQALKRKFFDCVDVAIGVKAGIAPKPCPDGVNAALKALGVNASDAVMVGDGETDILTAKNSGLRVIAVTWGFRERSVLECLRPDYIADTPSELTDIIFDMFAAKNRC